MRKRLNAAKEDKIRMVRIEFIPYRNKAQKCKVFTYVSTTEQKKKFRKGTSCRTMYWKKIPYRYV